MTIFSADNAANFIALYIILMDVVLTGYVLELLRRGGAGKSALLGIGFVGIIWLALLSWSIAAGGPFPSTISGAGYFAALAGVIGAVASAFFSVPAIRAALMKVPQELLLLPQGLRAFFGAGFLIAAVFGSLPPMFGIVDGLTHLIAAFLALKIGLLWAHGERRKVPLYFANLFGLLDIICVGLGIAFILLPQISLNHIIALAAFYAAPIFVALHLISLRRALKNS